MGPWSYEAIRFAWWALPVVEVAGAAYIICRVLRQWPACVGAMLGCLIGAFVPEPRIYACYRDAEAAFMAGLRDLHNHTLFWTALGAVIGGHLAWAVSRRWVRRARKPKPLDL